MKRWQKRRCICVSDEECYAARVRIFTERDYVRNGLLAAYHRCAARQEKCTENVRKSTLSDVNMEIQTKHSGRTNRYFV